MRIQICVVGFALQPITLIAVLDEKTGVLVIAKEVPYTEERIKEDFAVVSSSDLPDSDFVFKDEHLREAIRTYFDWGGSELVTVDELLGRHLPDNKIEQEGIDERGRKYRLGDGITNGQVAVLAAVAFAQQGIPTPSEPRLMIDAAGTLISATNPLPTTAAVTIGSISVTVGAPPDSNIMRIISVSATATTTASLANRKSVSVFNTSDSAVVWVSFDHVTATATVNASVPVWPYSFISTELDSAKIIGLVASTAVTAIVYQDGF